MTTFSRTPLYNLSAVLKETGLKADVLRAWERRYDLPKPQRTAGGHRLYSEYDIETVKWLRERQAEGLGISRAVELWKEMLEAGRDPLDEHKKVRDSAYLLPSSETRIDLLRGSWLEACLAFDESKAENVLNQAFALYPVEIVCTAILQEGMSSMGKYWYEGRASVQQEHFASGLSVRRLETLIAASPLPTRSQTILVGCPAGEWHTFSILLLSLLLRRKGMKVVYLGANIPILQIKETAEVIHPHLIVLAAQQLASAATLREAVLALAGEGRILAFGGQIFNRVPRLIERIPGYFLGEKLEEAAGLIERLVTVPAAPGAAIQVDEERRGLAKLYHEKRALIELGVLENLQKSGVQIEYLEEANSFFGSGLLAALELGDPAFMEADLEWVKKLLEEHPAPQDQLIVYLAAYNQVIEDTLGKDGAALSDWMHSYTLRLKSATPVK